MTSQAAQSRWRPYPEYKDSGVKWLGEIPAGWKIKTVKRIFNVFNGATPKSGISDYWDGDIFWVTPDDLGKLQSDKIVETDRRITKLGYRSCGTTLVPSGSLVLSTRAPIGHLATAEIDLCTNQGCRALVFIGIDSRKYFYYFLLAARPKLESLGQGATFRELSRDKLEAVELTHPPIPEQHAIATFLDRETAKIDALIEKKRQLISLLEEKRAAIISQAVTKGLDPDAPMKDSGVEWLGEIPAGWDVGELFRNWQVIDCKHRTATYVYEGIPIVSTTEVKPGRLNLKETRITTYEEYLDLTEGNRLPKRGDIIYTRNASLGSAAYVDTDEAFCMGQDVCLITSSDQDQLFLTYQLNSSVILQQLEALMVGATFRRINVGQIKKFIVVRPLIKDQKLIAEYLDRISGDVKYLILKIHEAINKLQEYRTALISAAVTGKIDVREASL